MVSVTEAVERDLRELAKRDKALAESGLAATALALAMEIDKPGNSATSKSMCSNALTAALRELRELAPAKAESSPLDEIRARRDKKLARTAEAKG